MPFYVKTLLLLIIFCSSAAADDKLPFTVPDDFRELPATALIETEKGAFEILFYREQAPISVANFTHLVKKKIYNDVSFHRYKPGFIIQGGDPTGTTRGGPGWTLPPEINPRIRHVRGAIGWARLRAKKNPERRSNGSQFYVTLSDRPGLDGFYTVFARVIRGMDVVESLRVGDKINRVRLPKKYTEKH